MKPTKNGILFALAFILPVFLAYLMAVYSQIAVFGDKGVFLEPFFTFIWLIGVLFFHSSDQLNRRLPSILCLELFEDFQARLAESSLEADWEPHGEGYRVTISGLVNKMDVSAESARTKVSKQVQGRDIEIGDDPFDDLAYLRGDELEIVSRLDSAQRARAKRLLAPVVETVTMEELESSSKKHSFDITYHWDLTIKDGILSFPAERLEDVFDRSDLEDLIELARGFAASRPGTKEERLVELVRGDPELNVRMRALSLLCRQREIVDVDVDALLVELIRGETHDLSPMTESEACSVLKAASALMNSPDDSVYLAAIAAAYWLAVHGETKESIEHLSRVGEGGLSDKDPIYPITNEALAAIRSRLGEFAGGLSVAESQEAGALSVAEQGGKLALADEGGELSLAEEEARRKQLAARARQKR
jgi:hypothetical protein